jgi:predicted unusual protein kinase regulating ubiquinone biosynthesis (AarF/ABC1/UbiB family)
MMNELKPNVADGFKEACLAVFGGGPYISDIQLDAAGKRLVDALEGAGVLAKGADRLSVEKLARYFIRSFKDVQIGKARPNIKQTLGADLQKLTEEQVFRFPSTFTFIFRSFASVDGIGKGLDDKFDIAKSAQPFIEALSDDADEANKFVSRFSKITGLNTKDIDTAITQPRKVAYLERTVRAMEQGNLKIRVRSLENELALGRLQLGQALTNKLLAASLLLNLGLAGSTPIPAAVYLAGSALLGVQAGIGALSIKIFDKKASRYESKDFN